MFMRDFKTNFHQNKEKQPHLQNTELSFIYMFISKYNLKNKNNTKFNNDIAVAYIFIKNFKYNKNTNLLECLSLFLIFFKKSNNVDYFFVNNGGVKHNQNYRNNIVKNKNIIQQYIACNVLAVKSSYNYFVNTVTNKLVKLNFKNINKVKFQNSSIVKYLLPHNVERLEIMFLRKNKVYNKGRYSRCRQNYRTGVYLCMYLSVISIFGLYYWFFKFSFQFTHLWWIFIIFIGSFFVPKIIKYRLYEPATLFVKFLGFFKWLSALFKSL